MPQAQAPLYYTNNNNGSSSSSSNNNNNENHHLEKGNSMVPATAMGVGYNQGAGANQRSASTGRRAGESLGPGAVPSTSPLGRLNGLQCDSFTLIDASAPTATTLSDANTAAARLNGAQRDQQQRRASARVSPVVGDQDRDFGSEANGAQRQQQLASNSAGGAGPLSVSELQAHRFKLKALAGEQNNNTIVTPIGSLAAALRMDSLTNSSGTNTSSGKPATQSQPQASVTNQAAGQQQQQQQASAQNGQQQQQSPGSNSGKQKSGQPVQGSSPSYSAILTQQQQSLTKTSSTILSSAPDSFRRLRWPGLAAPETLTSKSNHRDATPSSHNNQQQQHHRVAQGQASSSLKKQIALDLSEQSAVLLSKKSASSIGGRRNATNYSPPSRGSKSKLVETRDYDYVSNDDEDTDNVKVFGIENSGQDDYDDGDYIDEEEDEDEETSENDDDDEDIDDERLPFNATATAFSSKGSSRNLSLKQQEAAGFMSANKRSKLIGATNYSHYPGSATTKGGSGARPPFKETSNNERQQAKFSKATSSSIRLDKKASNNLLNSSPAFKTRQQLQSNENQHCHQQQNARISVNEIGRPPSFNTCQQQQSKQSGRECRKLDLLEQAACLNCNCNSCSKKKKVANQNGGAPMYQQVAKVGGHPSYYDLECAHSKPRYPKTHICHLILKLLVLTLCFLLLLLLLVGLIMLSIHMPKAFENALNAPHTFNVTIAG